MIYPNSYASQAWNWTVQTCSYIKEKTVQNPLIAINAAAGAGALTLAFTTLLQNGYDERTILVLIDSIPDAATHIYTVDTLLNPSRSSSYSQVAVNVAKLVLTFFALLKGKLPSNFFVVAGDSFIHVANIKNGIETYNKLMQKVKKSH